MNIPVFRGIRPVFKQPVFRQLVVLAAIAAMLTCFSGLAIASSGGSNEGGGTKGWVATDTWRVMNFTVLAVALFLLLKKPVVQALNARIKGIQDQLSDLDARKRDAEKNLAGYQEKITALDKESEKIIQEYIRQGNESKERILKEAGTASEKLEEQAKRMIENEFSQARQTLQNEVLEKALSQAEETVKKKISDADQERLVDEFLQKVVA